MNGIPTATRRKHASWLTATALCATVGFGIHSYAIAQDAPPQPPQDGSGQLPPGGGPGQRPPRPGGPPPVQMVAIGDRLFILDGHTLYKVNSANLQVESTAQLPKPEPPPADTTGTPSTTGTTGASSSSRNRRG